MLERSRRLLADPWLQRAILVAVIVWVFWDGIWAGIPRSDQILYLHDVSQLDSLWDILSRAPSWNRTHFSGGDEILYRPILYMLLGSFYYFFRYNFVAWQIAGLSLHVLVVLGLHLLLIQGRLKQTIFPLLIALLFGTAFLGSELVLWNHIVGYVLFCALEVYAIYFFLRYLQSDRTAFLIPCAVLALLAEFTYESGALVNLLFAATLLVRGLSAPTAGTTRSQNHNRVDRRLAPMFVLSALLLPIASLIDLQIRGFGLSSPTRTAEAAWQVIMSGGKDALLQIGFWMGGWLMPTSYRVYALDRAIYEMSTTGLTALRLLNLVALALLAVAVVLGLRRAWRSGVSKREPLLAVALCTVFLLGYSAVIAIGRTLPEGWDRVLHTGIYYSYIAYLTVCVAIALAAVAGQTRKAAASLDAGPDPNPSRPGTRPEDVALPSKVGRRFVFAFMGLAIVNICGVRELTRAFRYEYAAPRQEILDRVLAWQRQVGDRTQRYFDVSPTCRGNELIGWFRDPGFRQDLGLGASFAMVDALFSDRSARLMAGKIRIAPASVDVIHCEQREIRSPAQ
jgi:hypothetical protein